MIQAKAALTAALFVALFGSIMPLATDADSTPNPAQAPASVQAPACGEPDRQALVTHAVQPTYPKATVSFNGGLAQVTVQISIDEFGHLTRADIYKSSGDAALDKSALQAALASSYSPKRVNCKSVPGKYLFRADFEPDNLPPGAADLKAGSTAGMDSSDYSMARSDLPSDSQWVNPFCDASAIVVPWNKTQNVATEGASDTYALFVWAHAKSDYAARVTLIGDGAVYSVTLPKTAVASGSVGTYARAAYLVSVNHAIDVAEYFVDGVGVDGAQVGDCPSFVKAVTPVGQVDADLSPGAGFGHASALYAQAVPPLTCSAFYAPMRSTRGYSPLVGFYGNRPLHADVEVFVDSSGQIVKTRIWRSSGVDGIDDAALAAARYSLYRPARFMCTPVVSSEIVEVEYKP